MLVFAVFSAFLGFVFAAPGAVYISGPVGRRENGIISAAGPLANIVIALAFRLLPLGVISAYGASINGWLAFFNLIPVMGFDGSKVWRWNKGIYALLIAIAAIMAF
jgi:Zn-dependent protease